MYYYGKVIVAKEAKLLSLPLPQLAVSNHGRSGFIGSYFVISVFCFPNA